MADVKLNPTISTTLFFPRNVTGTIVSQPQVTITGYDFVGEGFWVLGHGSARSFVHVNGVVCVRDHATCRGCAHEHSGCVNCRLESIYDVYRIDPSAFPDRPETDADASARQAAEKAQREEARKEAKKRSEERAAHDRARREEQYRMLRGGGNG